MWIPAEHASSSSSSVAKHQASDLIEDYDDDLHRSPPRPRGTRAARAINLPQGLPPAVEDVLMAARHVLADASAFERGFDCAAAVARSREAAALIAALPDQQPSAVADLAAEIDLAMRAFEETEATWRRQIRARQATYVARESAEAVGRPPSELDRSELRALRRDPP